MRLFHTYCKVSKCTSDIRTFCVADAAVVAAAAPAWYPHSKSKVWVRSVTVDSSDVYAVDL
ncbi:hypothetical protein E2C01_007702 [Portunus trituberculatus]|uniref:Uncharacterized protein n=1 Tax=Portunus trituberculatus TaxID=210409 RepID=A0A5B7D1W4_PORTR|nr:hypothetical protein [Portunus trituberculatus]